MHHPVAMRSRFDSEWRIQAGLVQRLEWLARTQWTGVRISYPAPVLLWRSWPSGLGGRL